MQNRINASKSVFQNDSVDEEDEGQEEIENVEKMYTVFLIGFTFWYSVPNLAQKSIS